MKAGVLRLVDNPYHSHVSATTSQPVDCIVDRFN
jgi:hypothetical protein